MSVYSSCDVNLENLVLDQLVIAKLIFFFFLITCLVDSTVESKGKLFLITHGS